MAKEKLQLVHQYGMGDSVLMTALVRDISRAYPDRFEIHVKTNWRNIWWHNPYVSNAPLDGIRPSQVVHLSWVGAAKSASRFEDAAGVTRNRHILTWYHKSFKDITGIDVPVTEPKPDLQLTEEESQPFLTGRYWVVVSGGKLDMTVKHWDEARVQHVVDKMTAAGIAVVQTGATHGGHIHPPLRGAVDLVGKTDNLRDLWCVIKNADGVICGVTGSMHIAAAFDKPCVVYAGGREEPWFEEYSNTYDAFGSQCSPVRVPHKFLHTLGRLDCCRERGCWRRRTVPLESSDITKRPHELCLAPVRDRATHPIAACMDMITADDVFDAVMSYYKDGVLDPIPPNNAVQVIRQPTGTVKLQSNEQKTHRREFLPVAVMTSKTQVQSHPTIGGKMTFFVLCYGDYPDLAKRCLSNILQTVPITSLDIRVGANCVGSETLAYLKNLPITKLYVNEGSCYKYPMMRKMFYDESCPINTKYLAWFDDDTYVVNNDWFLDLCSCIIQKHPENYRMFGSLYYHNTAPYPAAKPWFFSGDWYTGKDLRQKHQSDEEGGSIVDFGVGWFWALETEAMRKANIPDTRLQHNGGDITIGEQLHQHGYRIYNWNPSKKHIACPTRQQGGRRGFSQAFPWDTSHGS